MRVNAIIIRTFQQLLRDKRTLALLFIAPLFVLTIMNFIFNGDSADLKLGVSGVPDNVMQVLNDADIDTINYETADHNTVINNDLDALLTMNNESYYLTLLNDDPANAKSMQLKVTKSISEQFQIHQMKNNKINFTGLKEPVIQTDYVYGNNETTIFDVFSPILICFFVFFFVFLISGIGLLRERTSGTLDRLLSTPVKRGEIVAGYLLGYGIFAVFQTLVIIFYSIQVLNITLAGSIWYVILINILCAFVALSLGILLSTFASSEFQMIQFIPIVIIPQIFFSGIFPLDGMAGWLRALSKIMPMYYGADALKNVMYEGNGFNKISFDLGILFLFSIVFIILNILTLKKYRRL